MLEGFENVQAASVAIKRKLMIQNYPLKVLPKNIFWKLVESSLKQKSKSYLLVVVASIWFVSKIFCTLNTEQKIGT